MSAQIYKIQVQEPDKVAPAQFVFTRSEDDMISGFIADVAADGCIFAFWEPMDNVPADAIIIAESVHDDIIRMLLRGAIAQNPGMEDEWRQVHANS